MTDQGDLDMDMWGFAFLQVVIQPCVEADRELEYVDREIQVVISRMLQFQCPWFPILILKCKVVGTSELLNKCAICLNELGGGSRVRNSHLRRDIRDEITSWYTFERHQLAYQTSISCCITVVSAVRQTGNSLP
jgi:hypothetical protein